MRNSPLLRPGLRVLPAIAAFPALAHAHPGHDGHELTWDLGHLAAHPLATLLWVLLLLAGIWGVAKLIRRSTKT